MNKIKKTTIHVFLFIISLCCLCVAGFSKAEINKYNTEPRLWKEITISYYQDFPWKKEYSHIKSHGCKKKYLPGHYLFLRCMASSHLLRPVEAVNRWHSDNGGMFSSMLRHNTRGKGFRYKEAAGVVKNIPHDGFVTGRFLIWKPDVRSYTFHNITTKSIVHINATPSHRFYVLNRKTFISIENIVPSDKLINSRGESVALLCPSGQHDHCGKSYNKGIPVPVYNLEVYNRHQYFVSTAKILVHNCTFLNKKGRAGISVEGGDLPPPPPPLSPSPPPEDGIFVDVSSLELLNNLPDDYYEEKNEPYLNKMKGVFYRGDSSPPEAIFEKGFRQKRNHGIYIADDFSYAASYGVPKEIDENDFFTNIYLIDFSSEYVRFKHFGRNYRVNSVPLENIIGCIVCKCFLDNNEEVINMSFHKLVKNKKYTGRFILYST